jgi:cytochrome c551/c552
MATKKKAVQKKTVKKQVATGKKKPSVTKVARKVKPAAKKSVKPATKKPAVPYITTDQGMKELQYHCEGIMDMIGEYIMIQNPKISEKKFKTEAHGIVRMIFGMGEQKALR